MIKALFRRITTGVLCLGLACLIAGCATVYNPVTGVMERTAYSTDDEIRLGETLDRQLKEDYKFSEDREVNRRVQEIGNRVAAQSGRDDLAYRFQTMETEEINAFAAPGGFVYVTTGLLEVVHNDDELAAVLGHEVGHIAARHAIKHAQSRMLFSIPASVIFSTSGEAAIERAVSAAFQLAQLSYSRKDELEADQLGMLYSRRAGYDPAGMVAFLQTLQRLEKEKPRLIIVPLSTHPPTSLRIEHAQGYLKSLPY